METIRLRLDAVAELTEREDLFYALQTVVSRFTDVDQLLSQCVQLPKQETVKTAEARITSVIVLKQCLELVPPLVDALAGCDNPLMRAYADALADDRFDVIRRQMMVVIHDDTKYQRGSLNMRAQKCFAVKVRGGTEVGAKGVAPGWGEPSTRGAALNMRVQKCFAVKVGGGTRTGVEGGGVTQVPEGQPEYVRADVLCGQSGWGGD